MQENKKGFFVDCDGMTRKTEDPGNGWRCEVSGNHVDVIDSMDFVVMEATFFATEEDLQNAGIIIEYVSK